MTLIFTGYHICVYICDPSEKTSKQNSAKKNSAKKYPIVKKNAPKNHNTVITKEKKNPPSKKGHLDTALKISQQEKSSRKNKCLQKRKNRNKNVVFLPLPFRLQLCPPTVFPSKCKTSTIFQALYSNESFIFIFATSCLPR